MNGKLIHREWLKDAEGVSIGRLTLMEERLSDGSYAYDLYFGLVAERPDIILHGQVERHVVGEVVYHATDLDDAQRRFTKVKLDFRGFTEA
jgi:hypothetical protein